MIPTAPGSAGVNVYCCGDEALQGNHLLLPLLGGCFSCTGSPPSPGDSPLGVPSSQRVQVLALLGPDRVNPAAVPGAAVWTMGDTLCDPAGSWGTQLSCRAGCCGLCCSSASSTLRNHLSAAGTMQEIPSQAVPGKGNTNPGES